MTRYRVLPYRQGSKGARALADALGGRVLKLEGSSFSPKHGDLIINWGSTAPYYTPDCKINCNGGCGNCDPTILNEPSIIKRASNKREFFQLMTAGGHEDVIPRYWTDASSIPDDAFPIVCRTVLAGHSGDGIVLAAARSDLVPAPLYVEYVKKQDEYRVHVGVRGDQGPSIIAVQRKARSYEVPDDQVNWQIRNHQNGFVYTRQGFTPPDSVLSVAKRALEASGLDFGAVDVIYNAEKKRALVLEINTAPGLEGQTVQDYASFFSSGSS